MKDELERLRPLADRYEISASSRQYRFFCKSCADGYYAPRAKELVEAFLFFHTHAGVHLPARPKGRHLRVTVEIVGRDKRDLVNALEEIRDDIYDGKLNGQDTFGLDEKCSYAFEVKKVEGE
ncbi:MAG: hypothetical protein HY548_09320 [Elusimicrobia bacterium]|nr:hypothetical protein [Elusimicrobiota bacterium]